jgi:hypothetical protein
MRLRKELTRLLQNDINPVAVCLLEPMDKDFVPGEGFWLSEEQTVYVIRPEQPTFCIRSIKGTPLHVTFNPGSLIVVFAKDNTTMVNVYDWPKWMKKKKEA